jgi:hypothetical protein
VTDAEPGEVLDRERAGSAGADHTDFLGAEDLLTTIAEKTGLAIVCRIIDGSRWRRRVELAYGSSNDGRDAELDSVARSEPNVACCSIRSENESADRTSVR